MKKIFLIFRTGILLILGAVIFTGCHLDNTAGVVSENGSAAVSGAAAGKDSAEEEKATASRQVGSPRANDRNAYVQARFGDALFQMDRAEEKVQKTIEMEIGSVEWVTNEWIYYSVYGDSDREELWRAPIEREKKGDQVKIKKREKLFVMEQLCVDYVTEDYLLMRGWEEGDENVEEIRLYKYDLKSKHAVEQMADDKLGAVVEVYTDDCSGNPIVMDGGLFIETDKGLFCLDPESGKSDAIFPSGKEVINDYKQSGTVLYFLLDNAFYQYDSISKKVSCLISEGSFIDEVDKLERGALSMMEVYCFYVEQENIYFEATVEWIKGNSNSKEVILSNEELFSVPRDHFDQMHREDRLMDYLEQKGKYEKDTDVGPDLIYYEHTGGICDIRDGYIYADYTEKNGKENVVEIRYDPATQKIKKMEEVAD